MNAKIFVTFILALLIIATVDATRRVYERGVLTGYLLSRNNQHGNNHGYEGHHPHVHGGAGINDLALLSCRWM